MTIVERMRAYRPFGELSLDTQLKALVAVVYGVAIPVLFWANTRSSLAIGLLLLVTIVITLVHVARGLSSGVPRHILNGVSSLITVVFGVSVLIGIVITPFSAYKLWFEAMAEGTGTGTVSNLFTLLAAFFSSTLAVTFLTMGYVWPLLMSGLFISALIAVIMQTPLFYALTVAASFLAIFYLLVRGRDRAYLGRRLGYAGGFFAVVLLLATMFSGSRAATGSRVIDAQLHPRLRQYVSNTLPQFPLLYGIPGYGYSFQERSLGGSPVLSPLPIFRVTADVNGPLYLKTDVFDFYDGKNWKTTFKPNQSIENPESIMLRGRPRRRDESIRIELLIDFYNKLPYTTDTSAFRFGRTVPPLQSGNYDRGFQLDQPLVVGDVMYLEVADPAVLELDEDEQRKYLQLPRGVSSSVSEIGESFADPNATVTQRLDNMATYLSGACTYSLNVGNLRRSEDFLEKFLLDERKGYCVHFATAFVVFARMNGIPARYNTGFLINFPAGKDETDVTGLAAHSWPEVFLDDRGWTRWEATPAVSPSAYANFFDEEELLAMYGFDMEMDSATLRQVQSILGDRELDIADPGALAAVDSQPRSPWRIVVPAAGVLLLPLLGWRVRRWMVGPRLSAELRPVIRVSRRYVSLGRTLGVPDPRKTGWLAWLDTFRERLASRTPAATRLLDRFTSLVARAVYAERAAGKRDLRFMRAAYWRLLRYRVFRA